MFFDRRHRGREPTGPGASPARARRCCATLPSAARTRTVTTTLSLRFGERRCARRAAPRSAFVLCSRSRTLRPAATLALRASLPDASAAPGDRDRCPCAVAAHATGPHAATTLTSNLFVSSCARPCLRRRASDLTAGVAGTSGDAAPPPAAAAPPPGCGAGAAGAGGARHDVERDARAIVLRERVGDRRVHGHVDRAASCGRRRRRPSTGISSVVVSAGISCGRSQTRSRPAVEHVQPWPSAGTPAEVPAGSVAVSRSARLRDGPALETVTVTVVRSPPVTSAGSGRGHGLVRRRRRRRDAEDLDLDRGRGLGALVVGHRRGDRVLALAERVRAARQRRRRGRARRHGPSSRRWRRRPAPGRGRRRRRANTIGCRPDGDGSVRARRRDLDRRRGVGHAHGDAGELRDRAAQAVGGRDREAARGRAGQRLGVDHERLARDAERQRAPRRRRRRARRRSPRSSRPSASRSA